MVEQKRRWLTRDRAFYRMLIALAIPISLQNLITFAVNFADNLMVSQLGDTAVSGVYMGNQIQTFLQLMLNGVVQTTGILAAQYWGKRDMKTIRGIVSLSMRVGIVLALVSNLIAAAAAGNLLGLLTDEAAVISVGCEYLIIVAFSFVFYAIAQIVIAAMRSVENARIGMYISLIALVANVCLNYVMIFGKLGCPAMGIRGAAIATLISRIVECMAAILYARFCDKKLKLSVSDFVSPLKNSFPAKDFFRCGLPIVAGEIVWAINTVTQSGILGHYSEEVITASSITGNMHTLVYIWVTGLASAIGVITGKTVGAGDNEKVKEYARTTQLLFLCVGAFTSCFIFCMRAPFVSLYAVSEQAAAYAMQFLAVLAVTMLGSCYQMPCLMGLVKAGGNVSFVFKNDTIHVFLIVLPLGLLAAHFGAAPWLVFALLKCDQILKCIVAAVVVNRYRWIRNLTAKTASEK
ncbi:MAG: MATE family efflux transporter [Clostridia bacterium]|nr:MATE family efflux transporter [Clostridia bacterium]